MEIQEFHALEARCAQEEMPLCVAACPVHADVRAMPAAVRKGDFSRAYVIFAQNAPFPGIISRVCDHPCQSACKRADLDDGIAVNALEQACRMFTQRPQGPLRRP